MTWQGVLDKAVSGGILLVACAIWAVLLLAAWGLGWW